eukprot:90370_1
MYSYMEEENKDIDISKVKQYVDDHEFDSDAVQADLEDATASNICKSVGYGNSDILMIDYSTNVNLTSMSFSTGYIFYYWNFFKKLSRKEIEGQGWDKLC